MSIKEIQHKINRITDILGRDDGINVANWFSEHISLVLFLNLQGFEKPGRFPICVWMTEVSGWIYEERHEGHA